MTATNGNNLIMGTFCDLKYAREGYRFYAVQTPTVFLEYELPEDERMFTPRERQKQDELDALADLHRTIVTHASYRRG